MIENVGRRFAPVDKLPITARPTPPVRPAFWREISARCRARRRSKAPSRTVWPKPSSKSSSGITRGQCEARCTQRAALARFLGRALQYRASAQGSGLPLARRVQETHRGEDGGERRSALDVDRMMARRPWRRIRSRPAHRCRFLLVGCAPMQDRTVASTSSRLIGFIMVRRGSKLPGSIFRK